ncbi:hypothetical protein [Methylocystis sp. S23]|jgi:hypothetical protein
MKLRVKVREKPMSALIEIVEWCRQERQRVRKLAASLESGRMRHAEDRGHGWVDTTAATISRLRLHLEELDEMLDQYESERARDWRTDALRERPYSPKG